MDSFLIESVLEEIQRGLDDGEVLSKKYIFDKKYAEHRNKNFLLSKEMGSETRLSFVVRYALTPEKREQIFQGIFDLGNTRQYPPDLCSRASLAEEIAGYKVPGRIYKDFFDTIFQGIFKIAGRTIQEFSSINELKTLRVIKTLHLLSTKRQSRLMQLLQSPELGGKFSYSFRNDYPYIKNQEQVWLIADLQTYLSIELNKDDASRVISFFRQLSDRFVALTRRTEKKLEKVSEQSIEKISRNFDLLNTAVNSFDVQSKRRIFELDHELFVHVNKLPFLHYAVGYRYLLECAKPDCAVAPINEEFISLIRQIFPGLKETATKFDFVISVDDIYEVIFPWEKEILEVVRCAFGDEFKLHNLADVMPEILSTFRLYNLFRFGLEAETFPNAYFSFWSLFAAVCSVLYSKNYPLTFRPYWLGQAAQGGSLNNSNFISDQEFYQSIDLAPEEHRFILFHRMEWFLEALEGNADLVSRRFDFRSAVVEKLLESCGANDIDQISQSFTNLEECIDKQISSLATVVDYRQKGSGIICRIK